MALDPDTELTRSGTEREYAVTTIAARKIVNVCYLRSWYRAEVHNESPDREKTCVHPDVNIITVGAVPVYLRNVDSSVDEKSVVVVPR